MAKRPIPTKPKLEKIDPDDPDYQDPLSEGEQESRPKKSKKLFKLFMIFLIICCAGGYGYIEYKKRFGAADQEVIKKNDEGEESDEFASANPDAENSDDSGESNNTQDEVEDLQFEPGTPTDTNVVTASEEKSETETDTSLDLDEPIDFGESNIQEKTVENNSTTAENNSGQEKEVKDDLLIDFGSDNNESVSKEPQEDFAEKSEENDKEFFLEPEEKLTEEKSGKTEVIEPDKATEEDFEAFDLNDETTSEKTENKPDEFFPVKEPKPLENLSDEKISNQNKSTQKIPAKRPPRLNNSIKSSKNSNSRGNTRSIARPENKENVSRFRWKQISSKDWQTPAGLVYGPGSREGHRIKHVLKHAENMPKRPGKHGVFIIKVKDDVFQLVDEAYQIAIKRGPPDVKKYQDGDRTVYTVNMKRKVGYIGGQYGEKNNNPPAYKIRFVLEGKNVITAFPM